MTLCVLYLMNYSVSSPWTTRIKCKNHYHPAITRLVCGSLGSGQGPLVRWTSAVAAEQAAKTTRGCSWCSQMFICWCTILTVTVRECASTNYSAAEKTSLEVEKVKSVLSERLLIHIRTCIRRRHLSTCKGATGTPPTTIVATNGV